MHYTIGSYLQQGTARLVLLRDACCSICNLHGKKHHTAGTLRTARSGMWNQHNLSSNQKRIMRAAPTSLRRRNKKITVGWKLHTVDTYSATVVPRSAPPLLSFCGFM